MQKRKRIKITFDKYDKIMGKIIKKGLSVHETLIEMLNEASKYDLIDRKEKKK